ncbi:MAG TPA: peptidylprolyl isomerase [Cytophagaceae bacterium]|jgi:peptidyl-prolyl cis-trans isomerase SurA|nr:peptidylprolyl isomerase [Cytophagaceae bacterium]
MRYFLFVIYIFIIPFTGNSQVLDEIIAKVDNQIVLKSELEIAYIQIISTGQQVDKCNVLETLIINKLLLAKAEIDSVTVDKETVNEQLDRRMAYFIQQAGGDASQLEAHFNKSLDDLKSDLRKSVKEQMITQKMQESITGKVKVNPSEVKKFFNGIPSDSLPLITTEVEVAQIVKIPQVGKNQKAIARAKLEDIKKRILKGENFCKLAQLYSEDPGSAKNCGELGWFKRGELVPPFEAAAMKLKPGEYSDIVESDFGFHFIQLIERRANEYNSRHILVKPNSSTRDVGEAEHFLDSIRLLIMKDSMSFEKAANSFSGDRETKTNGGFFLDPETGSTRIPFGKLGDLYGVLFFIVDTMQTGHVSVPQPFRLADETEAVRIIYLKSRIPPHTLNLKDDYQKIYKAALSEKKDKALNEWFDKTKSEVFIDIDNDYKNCDILKTQ